MAKIDTAWNSKDLENIQVVEFSPDESSYTPYCIAFAACRTSYHIGWTLYSPQIWSYDRTSEKRSWQGHWMSWLEKHTQNRHENFAGPKVVWRVWEGFVGIKRGKPRMGVPAFMKVGIRTFAAKNHDAWLKIWRPPFAVLTTCRLSSRNRTELPAGRPCSFLSKSLKLT